MKKLNELLGTRLPIIQGGMANIATGEFAAACSNAGALGIVASDGVRSAQELLEQIDSVRKSGLTFAPEAGTQRLRDVINKNVTEE